MKVFLYLSNEFIHSAHSFNILCCMKGKVLKIKRKILLMFSLETWEREIHINNYEQKPLINAKKNTKDENKTRKISLSGQGKVKFGLREWWIWSRRSWSRIMPLVLTGIYLRLEDLVGLVRFAAGREDRN